MVVAGGLPGDPAGRRASRNIAGGTWWADLVAGVDARDGVGRGRRTRAGVRDRPAAGESRNAAATRRGWDVGTLRSADIGADRLATFRYRVTVPGSLFIAAA